ncbi:kinase-like protein, partial [Aureobasidium melanogenum]
MSDISEPQHLGIISQCYDETFKSFYQHDKNLTSGGQGDVTLNTIRATGKIVVIKRLKLAPNANLRAIPELIMLDRVQKLGPHPNILPYLQIWNTPAAPGECPTSRIVLPYVYGGDLKSLKAQFQKMNCKVPEAFIFHAFKQMSTGFSFLHENGISHRDIKPMNIVVDPVDFGDPALFPNLKIIDFGIAAETTLDHETFDGTPKWQPPEAPIAGAKADVFAIGAVIHFLATGSATKLDCPQGVPEDKVNDYYRTAPSKILRLVNPGDHDFALGSLSLTEAQDLTFGSGKPLPRGDFYSPLLEYYMIRTLDSNPSTRITLPRLASTLFDDADRQINFYKAWFRKCKAENTRATLNISVIEPHTNWTPEATDPLVSGASRLALDG